ncbi:MAG: tetratricopeptide repeat protein [Myxococcales bacterium]|nr:tetratricopeptide repeat protein [Myxococcales bacterium]
MRLTSLVGYDEGRAREGFDWAEHARAASRRVGDAEPGPEFHEALGHVQGAAGEYEAAVGSFERALALRVATLGPAHPGLAEPLGDLGTMHQIFGDYARATESMTRALELTERALGPAHPNVAIYLRALGLVANERGRFDEARALLERARARSRRPRSGPSTSSWRRRWARSGACCGSRARPRRLARAA